MYQLATVMVALLEMWNETTEEANRINELIMGTVVTVLWRENETFLFVETQTGYRGYVRASGLLIRPYEGRVVDDNQLYCVEVPFVDVLKGVGYSDYIITTLYMGTKVLGLEDKKNNRQQVMLPDGRIGYVRMDCLMKYSVVEALTANEKRERVIRFAKLMLDKQFRWGGRSIMGVDCSGLVSLVYELSGMPIWRDSDFDTSRMMTIDANEAKPGDVVYFSEHNGIYLGNDDYMHAMGLTGRVLISSFNPDKPSYNALYDYREMVFARYKDE